MKTIYTEEQAQFEEEGNKIIGQFLNEDKGTGYFQHYESDWNMLMRAVAKINEGHKYGMPGRDLLYTLSYLFTSLATLCRQSHLIFFWYELTISPISHFLKLILANPTSLT